MSVRRDPPRWPWLRSSSPEDSDLLYAFSFASTLRGIQCLKGRIGITVRMGSKKWKNLFFPMVILIKKSGKNKEENKSHIQLPFLLTICHTETHLGPPLCCHGMEKTDGQSCMHASVCSCHAGPLSLLAPDTTFVLVCHLDHANRHPSFFMGSLQTSNHRNYRFYTLNPAIQRKPKTVPHC